VRTRGERPAGYSVFNELACVPSQRPFSTPGTNRQTSLEPSNREAFPVLVSQEWQSAPPLERLPAAGRPAVHLVRAKGLEAGLTMPAPAGHNALWDDFSPWGHRNQAHAFAIATRARNRRN
jgi:hypothetical protein